MNKKFGIAIILVILVVSSAIFVIQKNGSKNSGVEKLEGFQALEPTNALFDPQSLGWQESASSAPWENRDSQASVVYKNKVWIMGGVDASGQVLSVNPGNVDYGKAKYFSDVWSSEDGANWQLVASKAPWGERRSIEVVDFRGKMWLMGGWGPKAGYKNDVWSSTDGINWKKETGSAAWPAREGHQLVVFQDKMWLIGGVKYGEYHILSWLFGGITIGKDKLFNDVWYSSDGIDWKLAVKNSPWALRWDFASVAFNNKLWVVAGMDYYGNIYKDIWYSENGKDWKLATDNPPFALRQGGTVVNYQNKIWVLGRLNSVEYNNGPNDVWYSSDGVEWKKTKADPQWTGREDYSSVVFRNKIWIFGGMDKDFKWKNDVWQSTSNLD